MRRFARSANPGWAPLASLLCLLPASSSFAEGATLSGQLSAQAEVAPPATTTEAQSPTQSGDTTGDRSTDEDKRRARKLRAGSTYFGPVGGIYVVDAGSGAPQSLRLQLMTDFFVKKNYLYRDDKNRYTGGVLSLGISPIEYLELSAAVTTRSNRNSRTEPEVLQATGDLHFDVKGYYEPIPGLTFGADAMVSFLNGPGDVGIDFQGTSATVRANLALDLRELANDVPLQLRLNLGHTFDNSTEMVEDLEQARFDNLVGLGLSSAQSKGDEYRHLIRRDERLALGIQRVDRTLIALGAEVPMEVSPRFAIHPIVEWELGIPVNRRDFDCPYPVDAQGNKLGGADSCLDKEGVDTWPQRVTVGARFYPWVRGLNALAAVEIGTGGTTNFVAELAPTAPYKVLLALGYTADLAAPTKIVHEVEKRVEVPVAPPVGHVRGRVVEQGTGAAVGEARIFFEERALNPLLANADGTFVSYPFQPGSVAMRVEAEDYEPGSCAATIPPEGGDVETTCELVALPRVGVITGRVTGTDGASVGNATVLLNGPESRSLTTDAAGRFREENLPPGAYSARIEHPGYLLSVTPVEVKPRAESGLDIELVPTPKTAQVEVKKDKLQIRGTIHFASDTADIEPRSEPLLTEIADALLRNPEVLKVEVQGHTDNTGTAEHNRELSERRAQAVVDWLAGAGVERTRLIAKGYGMERPLVPNVTAQGRARNRRVEFVILERSAEGSAR